MKSKKILGRCLLVLLCIVAIIAIAGVAQFYHRSDPKNRKQYETTNPFITGATAISAHRSGAGEAPYADLHGDDVPDELRILSLDEYSPADPSQR